MDSEAGDGSKDVPPTTEPQAANPWYLLATIYGEATESDGHWNANRANRRIWNGWSCGDLPLAERAELADALHVDLAELSPWSVRERQLVEQRFARHSLKLPARDSPIDLNDMQFQRTLYMNRFVFSGLVSFNNARFFATAHFDYSVFRKPASFHSAMFDGRASFSSAHFNGHATFHQATFSDGTYFGSAKFKCGADLSSVTINGEAGFASVDFNDDAQFNQVRFGAKAMFHGAEFRKDVTFYSSRFSGIVQFTSATFTSGAYFQDCEFDRQLNFRAARFLSRYPIFAGAILHQNVYFSAKDEYWLATPDNWRDPAIDDYTYDTPAEQKKAEKKRAQERAEEHREALSIIRHAIGKQGLPEEEHYFFRREMDCAARIGTPLQRLPYQTFDLLSDYGYSLAKPALWLGTAWLIGLPIYLYWLTWLPMADARAHPIFAAAGLSFSNLIGFLGFSRLYFGLDFLNAMPTFLKFFAALQTVVGVILLFLLGLGLRNRFRLR